MSMTISKTRYCAGVQCLKRLYLIVHSLELAAHPTAADQAIIEQGREVGMLARQLFPSGVEVRCEGGQDAAIRTTRDLLANPEIPAIFEGVFEHQNVLAKVDILHRRRDGRWRLIEVKSTTDVRDHHLEDVALQYRVVSRSGVDLATACLGHINRNYIYPGGEIDPRRFFRVRNLTRRVQRLQPKLTFQLRSEFTVLGMPKAPDVAPGRHCTNPITCEFYDRCNPPRPDDYVGYLPRIHASAMEELEEKEAIRSRLSGQELGTRACSSSSKPSGSRIVPHLGASMSHTRALGVNHLGGTIARILPHHLSLHK